MPQAESLSAQSDGVIQPYGDSPLDEEALAETVYLNIINQAQRYVYKMCIRDSLRSGDRVRPV